MNFKYEITYQNKQELTLTVVYIPEDKRALSVVRVVNYSYDDTPQQIKDRILALTPHSEWKRAIERVIPDIELGKFDSNIQEALNSFNRIHKIKEQTLSELKELKKIEIEAQLLDTKTAGVGFDFNGEFDLIQLRNEIDQINIINLVNRALNTKSDDPIFAFRAESNTVYALTATQVLEMNNTANSFIEALYQKSWELKELIKDADSEEALADIVWDYDPTQII